MGLSLRARWIGVSGLVILALAILGGCTTRTAGMQAPLPHDYDPLMWRPLDSDVAQEVTVAPAYSALVENDPGTDARALQARIDRLPDDVRASELVELRLALRPADDRRFDAVSTVQVSRLDDDEVLFERRLIDLRFEREWAVLTDLPGVEAGDVLLVELDPASLDTGWEYGYATGPVPYGGSGAILNSDSRRPVELGRALGFQTIFNQRTDAGDIVASGVESAARGMAGDPVLIGAYGVLILAGGGAAFAWRGLRPGGMHGGH